MWRQRSRLADMTPEERGAALVPQCEERLNRAMAQERPRRLIASMREHSCTAIKAGDCAKCRMCPAGSKWQEVAGYYNSQKSARSAAFSTSSTRTAPAACSSARALGAASECVAARRERALAQPPAAIGSDGSRCLRP
eukprot:4118677-Prymnesium_polylepis.1